MVFQKKNYSQILQWKSVFMMKSYVVTSSHFICWIFSTQLCNPHNHPSTLSDLVRHWANLTRLLHSLRFGIWWYQVALLAAADHCPHDVSTPSCSTQPPAPTTSESCSVRVWFFVTLWPVAHLVPLSVGFSRQEYWSGSLFPSPGGLPNPGIDSQSSALQTDSLLSEPPGKLPGLKAKAKHVVQWGHESRSSGHLLLLVSLSESQVSRLFFTNKLSSRKK